MRILLVSSEFPPGPGGIGTHAYQLANYFSNQSHDVLILSPQDYVSDIERDGFNKLQKFKIITLSQKGNLFLKVRNRAKIMKNALLEFKPDIVLVSGGRSIWLSAVLLKGKQIPWIVVGHGTEFGASSVVKTFLTRATCNQADAVIAVSDYTRSCITSLGITKPRIKVIHNGADAQYFHILPLEKINAFRQVHGVNEKFVLLTVGNVSPRKGQEWVIRALPAIIKHHPDVVYWIAGLPSEQKKLERLAVGLGVSKHIHFWGRVDQATLLNLYNACDLFVMTSQQLKNGDFEGYGIAVIEAALCGKTSLVTNNSGLAEAVQERETGLLVPQGEVLPIADAVLSLIDSPEMLGNLSEKAKNRAMATQTWQHIGASYLQYFEEIFGEG